MYCAECGTANSIGADTCEICGSPLGPSTGDRMCHACGAPIGENDRFCRGCGQSQSGAEAARFEPGPSFVDDSALQVDPMELPPWLREMTPSDFGAVSGFPGATTSPIAQSDPLPPWLDAAPTTNELSNSTASQPSAPWPMAEDRANDEQAASFSLISEDDLPEWLRALGDQEPELAPEPRAMSVTTANGARHDIAAPTLVAPAISRAWLNRPRAPERESVDDVAADFAPMEANVRHDRVQSPTAPVGASAEPVAAATATAAPALPVDRVKSGPRGTRLILLSAIVVIVVVVAFYLLSSAL